MIRGRPVSSQAEDAAAVMAIARRVRRGVIDVDTALLSLEALGLDGEAEQIRTAQRRRKSISPDRKPS